MRDLEQPTYVSFLPTPAGVLLVSQRDGVVRIVDGDRLFPDPFLDLRGWVALGSEQGFYALVPHPGYEENGRLFAAFVDLDGQLMVAEFRGSADPLRADPGSACTVIRVPMPSADHVGGGLAVGGDGMLYLGVGDGGGSGDPERHGQRLDVLQAKVLRIDIESPAPYGVPPDNPFVGEAQARPEIWAYGVRNPWRLTIDAPTGDLWITDAGQARFEEVNRAAAGRGGINFGWNVMEGPRCYRRECDPAPFELPIATYGHDPACAIAGGTRYRGTRLPALTGRYLFGDFCSGSLWSIDAGGTPAEPRLLIDSDAVITHVASGPDGQVLVTDFAGALLRLEPVP